MELTLAVFAGYTLNHDHVTNSEALEPCRPGSYWKKLNMSLADASTKWGAQRIKDGYPKPFPLHYVEIGNEDGFDRSGSYEWRFAQFFDAIRAKYSAVENHFHDGCQKPRVADVNDEHTRVNETAMEAQAFKYDTRKSAAIPPRFLSANGLPSPARPRPRWPARWAMPRGCVASNATPTLSSCTCHAPLLVNVSQLTGRDRSMQWNYNLIGYDALNIYGSPAYYAQKMFSLHMGDEVVAISAQNLPVRSAPAGRNGGTREVKSLFYSATRDSASGKIIVKIVNSADTAQPVTIDISGVKSVAAKGTATVLKAASRTETNSLKDPQHVVPVTEKIKDLGTSFTRTFPPCSITILELDAK